jgi:ubiquinone/menaquinone biosynthesis C-methylase UbiE
MTDDHSPLSSIGEEQSAGVFDTVRDGYDAVYDALSRGDTFNRLWRDNAYRGEFPQEFAHIAFLTLDEAQRLKALLRIDVAEVLVDVACGAGGPGLWMARETGASLVGIDPSEAGLAAARSRAGRTVPPVEARFVLGSFASTGLVDGSVDAVMSIDAFQYAPDKRAGIAEFARILRPGGRVGFICFEVDPAKVEGVPVIGGDPVPDYAPLLEAGGFTIETYEETTGWEQRVYAAFGAIVANSDELTDEMGERAAAGAIAEAMLTVQLEPYLRRVLVVARTRVEHA